MKNFAYPIKAFSFCLIFSAFFIIIGCGNDEALIEEEPLLQMNKILDDQQFILPIGLDDLEQEKEYLRNVSDLEALKLIKNYKVLMFLRVEDKLAEFSNELEDIRHLSDLDLGTLLTSSELQKFENFDPNDVAESRWILNCWIESGNCWTRKKCCWVDWGNGNYCWIVWKNGYC